MGNVSWTREGMHSGRWKSSCQKNTAWWWSQFVSSGDESKRSAVSRHRETDILVLRHGTTGACH